MTKLKDWLIAAGVLALGRGTPPPRDQKARIVAPGDPDRRAENVVLALFFLATLAGAAFIVVYALDRLSHDTQWLGLAIGAAFALLALASTVIAHRLVVTEEVVEPYPEDSPDAQDEIEQIVEESGSRFTRKRLVTVAGAGALGTLGAALLAPAASLGPVLHTGELYRAPWRRGRRLVGDDGRALSADEIEEGTFYTAYPEGADRFRGEPGLGGDQLIAGQHARQLAATRRWRWRDDRVERDGDVGHLGTVDQRCDRRQQAAGRADLESGFVRRPRCTVETPEQLEGPVDEVDPHGLRHGTSVACEHMFA